MPGVPGHEREAGISEESKSSVSELRTSHGLRELFRGDTDEMLVVHNTFLELCKMTDLQTVATDRFVSAPAMFGVTIPSKVQSKPPISESVETREQAETELSSMQTTVMVRNIPTRTSVKVLLELLEKTLDGLLEELVDFVYLPIDFKTNKNLGYCFINFTSPELATACISELDSKKYVFCDTSEKQLQISYSNRQGYFRNLEVFAQTKMLDTWPSHFRPLSKVNGTLVPVSADLLAQILGGQTSNVE
jgi:hypothetical protein